MLSVTQPNACVAGFCLCRTLRGDTGDAAHFLLREVDMKKFRFTALLLCLAVLCGALLALAACNDSGSSGQSGSTSGEDPPAEKTVSVADVYDGMGVSMDFDGMLEKEADELADETYGAADVKSYGVEDGKFQVLSMAGDSLSSVVVELPEETLNYLNGDVKENVLDRAQLTADQQVKESERQQIVDRLTSAVEYIESQIGNISNLPASRVNYYADGETQENVNASTLFSVLGPVLADGSFIRYDVRENGNLFETVIIVPNADGKTEQQIYEAYFSGNYSLGSSTEVDLGAKYTPPTPTDPDNPDPDNPGDEDEETITIGEIFDQNFANIDFSAELEKAFQKIYSTGYTSSTAETKFYAVNENTNELSLYFELTRNRNGALSFNELKFLVPASIAQINGDMEDYILGLAGYSSQDEIETTKESQALDAIQAVVDLILDDIAAVGNTELSNLSSRTIINHNEEITNPNTFGEALMEDMGAEGTLIATYVGDMSGRILDAAHRFDTGYYSDYDITIVYKQGDQIIISTRTIYNAWYTDSTNDSLYNNLLNGTDDYQLGSATTIIIESPTATAAASSEAEFAIC